MPQLLNDRQQTERAKSKVKETGKEANQKGGERREAGGRNLQRDTPFLDRLGFGGGTGRRGSCACVRVP